MDFLEKVHQIRKLAGSHCAILITDREDGTCGITISWNKDIVLNVKKKTELIEQTLSCFKGFYERWLDELENQGHIKIYSQQFHRRKDDLKP